MVDAKGKTVQLNDRGIAQTAYPNGLCIKHEEPITHKQAVELTKNWQRTVNSNKKPN